ncbi:PP2C family protein-serine/threonine phosphatase [Ornithinicoccus halotolerans]|uniref:PP2C family protein-serine/threonine phosphatase n=1 Tax=Ornithinicoccus halotolerans TaxID=1748220 RepID=UPI001297AF60|nr:protein phosphatase 2C domain-containing protein [Ornithinicoccus halotolerans]
MDSEQGSGGSGHGVAARTHTGHVRERNEDSLHVGDGFWLVADGLGGHEGGAIASALATAAITALARLSPGSAGLTAAITSAHHVLVEFGAKVGLAGMGTTVVAAMQEQEEVTVVWVGDSRAYQLTETGLRQLTRDHNQAGELLAQGLISEEQAASHPGQTHLTRALGTGREQPPEPDTVTAPAQGRLLLCSDGLTGELDNARIQELLSRGNAEEAADALLEAALASGADDNVTLVVIDLGSGR